MKKVELSILGTNVFVRESEFEDFLMASSGLNTANMTAMLNNAPCPGIISSILSMADFRGIKIPYYALRDVYTKYQDNPEVVYYVAYYLVRNGKGSRKCEALIREIFSEETRERMKRRTFEGYPFVEQIEQFKPDWMKFT